MGPVSQPKVDQEVKWAVGEGGWAGGTHPALGSHSALEVAEVRVRERGPRAGRGRAPVEEPPCQPLLVHRHESLFLYKGWGWGALYPSSPVRGPVDVAIFGTIPVIPVEESCPQ